MNDVGSTLNSRYLLNKNIGEGGFAQVFLATDLELGRQVAIKVLEPSWARDKELLARFRKEARAVAVLDHPNILQIYDFGVAKGSPYLVMPYVSGGTFSAHMKRGQLTLDEIGFYLDQISSALDYAHQHGIVHRDVKPTNLLMRPNGQLVLMDFGLAKLLTHVGTEEQTAIVGTVAYMAPEQFHGLVSAASDIYVLGVLLYQMLTGKLPYEGNTTEVLVGHIHLTPSSLVGQPTMSAIPPVVVQALDLVLLKVLAKSSTGRYPSCQALTLAYYAALKLDPARAARYSNRESSRKHDFSDTLVTEKERIIPPAPQSPGPSSNPNAALPSPYRETTLVTPNIPSIPDIPTITNIPPPPLQGPGVPIGSSPSSPTLPTASANMEITQITPPEQLAVLTSPALPPIPSLAKADPDPDATQLGPKPSKPQQHKKVLLKPARLIVTTEPDKGFHKVFDLIRETSTLGRATDNTLCVPLSIISRHHAVLHRLDMGEQEPTYKIVQDQTINPLCFKGRKVKEKVLEHGDIIEIGERGHAEYIVKLTYQAPEYGPVARKE